MIDLEAIRERLSSLRALVEKPPKRLRDEAVALLDAVAADIARLVGEIEGLRSSCRHSHLIDEVDDSGRHTGAAICVTCHGRFHRDEPLPPEPSGDLG